MKCILPKGYMKKKKKKLMIRTFIVHKALSHIHLEIVPLTTIWSSKNFFFILQIRKLELMLVHIFPKSVYVCAKSLQSCLTLCDPMDCSLPGSSDQGIFQARTLEWVALPSFRGSSWCRDRTWVSYISYIGRRVPYLFTIVPSIV